MHGGPLKLAIKAVAGSITMTDDATDETPPKGACLHCNAEHNKIQVHCDSCGGFICSECHWCHEVSQLQFWAC
jgi:hypothetical protein